MPNSNATPRRPLPLIIVSLAVAIVAVALIARRDGPLAPSAPKPLPTLSRVPDFELTDSTSHSFGLNQLTGHVWVATFFFTTCPTLCPIMMNSMGSVYAVHKGNLDVHFVAVTVNPQYDSPAVLTVHATALGADPDQWHFLTGPLEAIQELSLNGLKIGTQDDPINHSAYFVLVDQSSYIRGYYDGQDGAEVERLTMDIERLLSGEMP
ncbi:MAG: SCO family protein [Lentisphaerae bacterium]|nr:SCO family protein [Lentisphaerota bacterium]